MIASAFTVPGLLVARERSPPHRGIIFNPKTRHFFWEGSPLMSEDPYYIRLYHDPIPAEQVATLIDDETMATCLTMAITSST